MIFVAQRLWIWRRTRCEMRGSEDVQEVLNLGSESPRPPCSHFNAVPSQASNEKEAEDRTFSNGVDTAHKGVKWSLGGVKGIRYYYGLQPSKAMIDLTLWYFISLVRVNFN